MPERWTSVRSYEIFSSNFTICTMPPPEEKETSVYRI
jgi:hypothetical protein